LKILSLFSGAGGLDLGFEQQGFEPILAYDIKRAAVETYNFNRPGKNLAKVANLNSRNIAEIIIRDIELLGTSNEPIGVVGGPPCQYFSMGNKTTRDAQDVRRLLPRRYATILHKLNEKYNIDFFILENVDGLTKPNHENDLRTLIKLFDAAGFHTTWKVLDARNYGVPQIRKRVFVIGWNKQLYPPEAYKFPEGCADEITVRDTIEGLADPVYFSIGLKPEQFPVHPNHWTMVPRSKKFGTPIPQGLSNSVRSFRRLQWDKPSYTVAYGHNEIHIHPNGLRRLSIYEAMLLQGFPKGKRKYRLMGSLTEQVMLVSDAVPPPLASALAASIKRFIELCRY
jgi:DNA (cytosine-5)-methyltransferase 1